MRRFIISFFSIIILYALQCTLFSGALSIADITPNLILMFTCIVGYMRGRASGLFTGFFGGLLIDIMGGKVIGFTALLYMFAGFLNGIFHKEYVKEQLIFPISLVVLCDFLYGIAVFVTGFLVRNKLSFGFYAVRIIFPEMIYTGVITIFAYVFVYFINRKLILLEKKKEVHDAVKSNNSVS